MSIEAMVWALKKAPVSEPMEALILVGLADHAGDDGTDAYPSQALLAKYGRCSPSTVKRRLASLESAGLIQRGDQQKVAHLPPNRRPIVWDLNLHVVTCAGQHAEDVIEHPEEILGGQPDPPVTTDTPDTPNFGGSQVTGGSLGESWGVTQDTLGGHGWTTNRPLTSLKPSFEDSAPAKPAKAVAAHVIPADFHLTPERALWVRENAPAIVNAKRETDRFIDYFRGEGGKKKNWETTWRNWMRKEQTDAERRGWKPPTPNQQSHVPTGYAMFNR
jgi:hypothetical protein